MVRVKICGITKVEDARAATQLGADAIGVVFARSPRRVGVEAARKISCAAGPWVTVVGVFVNQKPSLIMKMAAQCRLGAIQLHGDEKPSDVRRLLKTPLKIIKAFRVNERFDFGVLEEYPADAFLLDTHADGRYGGTGKKFDWSLLKKRIIRAPWMVSGGLRPDNVAGLLRLCEPYGVDVSSGVEKSPGSKDVFLLRKFIQNVKAR